MSEEFCKFATKPFQNPLSAAALAIQTTMRRANTAVGQNRVASLIERSPAWMSQFFSGQAMDAALTFEGISRLFAALELSVGEKSSDQVLIDELSALALKQAVARSCQERLDDTLELQQLRKLAAYGFQALMAHTEIIGEMERAA